MRPMALIPAAVVLFGSAPAVAYEWTPFVSIEDGFSGVYPGPQVETITYPTEYRMTLPGCVYSAATPLRRTEIRVNNFEQDVAVPRRTGST